MFFRPFFGDSLSFSIGSWRNSLQTRGFLIASQLMRQRRLTNRSRTFVATTKCISNEGQFCIVTIMHHVTLAVGSFLPSRRFLFPPVLCKNGAKFLPTPILITYRLNIHNERGKFSDNSCVGKNLSSGWMAGSAANLWSHRSRRAVFYRYMGGLSALIWMSE